MRNNNLIGISGKIGSGKDTIGSIINYIIQQYRLHGQLSNAFETNAIYGGPGEYEIKKFAYKLKLMVSLLTGIPVEDLEKQQVKDRVLGKEWDFILKNNKIYLPDLNPHEEYKEMTVRLLLQRLGTEAIRNVIHPNAWINALFADYKPINCEDYTGKQKFCVGNICADPSCYPRWIITDVRFPNEAEAIKERGGILIRTTRDIILDNDNQPIRADKSYSDINVIKNQHPSETALDNYEGWDYQIDNNSNIRTLVNQIKIILELEKII